MGNKSFIFRFDDAEVREREFVLTKAGKVLAVEPKAFRTLLFLLRHPQKLISKEELLNSVWGDAAVTEGSLTRCIWLLRRLLEDDINQPRYIETVATVGYRFVCKVEASEDTLGNLEESAANNPSVGSSVETAANGVVAATSEKPPAQINRDVGDEERDGRQKKENPNGFRRWLLAGAAALACLAVAGWYLRRPPLPLRVTEYTQITHDGLPKNLAGSDGSRLYFNRFSGTDRVAEVAISGGETARIPVAIPDPFITDVSPDGSALLVESINGPVGLQVVQVPSGSVRPLTTDIWVNASAWSPDGGSVVYNTWDGEIKVIRKDGTGASRLTSAGETGGSSGGISWSPNGATIRFSKGGALWEISPNGSNLHRLFPTGRPSNPCCGRWTPDGRFYVFLSAGQIWSLDERRGLFRRAAAEPVQLTTGPIQWSDPIPSKDGKKIFSSGVILHGELVRYDSQSKTLQPWLGGVSAEFVAFSPDGRSMVYVTFPEGILWKANRDGSNPVQLLDPPWHPFLPRWSPDSSQILFSQGYSGEPDRGYIVSSQGGAPKPILPDYKEEQGDLSWSPDGRRIVFASQEFKAGKLTDVIKVVELSSHKVDTIPGSQSLYSPRWSPNGRFIAGLSQGSDQPNVADQLTVFDFETQRWSTLQREGGCAFPSWSRDGQFIYYLHKSGVYRVRVSGGTAEKVVDLKGLRITGSIGAWLGLDPQDTPVLLRDVGTEDIYALTLEEK